MTFHKFRSRVRQAAVVLLTAVAVSGCRSHHVEITVENHTSSAVQLLEVDYPSASFGADKLVAGAIFKYRVQIRGTGNVKVQYTDAGGNKRQTTGPSLSEGGEGQLQVVLLPDGKAEFSSHLATSE